MAAWVKPTPIWCFYWQNDLSITQNSQMGTVDLVIVMINDALRRVASYKCTLSCAWPEMSTGCGQPSPMMISCLITKLHITFLHRTLKIICCCLDLLLCCCIFHVRRGRSPRIKERSDAIAPKGAVPKAYLRQHVATFIEKLWKLMIMFTRQLILLLRYEETICDLVWIEMMTWNH